MRLLRLGKVVDFCKSNGSMDCNVVKSITLVMSFCFLVFGLEETERRIGMPRMESSRLVGDVGLKLLIFGDDR